MIDDTKKRRKEEKKKRRKEEKKEKRREREREREPTHILFTECSCVFTWVCMQ
jgi:hypothetical protein